MHSEDIVTTLVTRILLCALESQLRSPPEKSAGGDRAGG